MITTFEELGETLAQFENRIAALENSMPSSVKEEPQPSKLPEPEWVGKQWDAVQQTKAMVLHLQSKIVELSKKKKPKSKYD